MCRVLVVLVAVVTAVVALGVFPSSDTPDENTAPPADRAVSPPATNVAEPSPADVPELDVADYQDMQQRMVTVRAQVAERLSYFHSQPWYQEVQP